MSAGKYQELTFTVYPPFAVPEPWRLHAYVVGDWAVHRPHPDEPAKFQKRWHISHALTGASAFWTTKKSVAIDAAIALAGIESPFVEIVPSDKPRPTVAPLPIEWIENAARVLAGMDVWADCYTNSPLRPEELPEYIRGIREPQLARAGQAT